MAAQGKIDSAFKELRVFWEKEDMFKSNLYSWDSCLQKCMKDEGS